MTSQARFKDRDVVVIAPGQVKAVRFGRPDFQSALERRVRVTQAQQFQLVANNVCFQPVFDIGERQGGAVDFLVSAGASAVRGRVIILAGKQVQVPDLWNAGV